MNIAGVLVHARPERAKAVAEALAGLDGVEVHQIAEDGRMVVTVEEACDRSAGDSLLAMHRMEGVLSAALVYHHFETLDDPSSAAGDSEENDDATVTA